jgi:hypothetical protein
MSLFLKNNFLLLLLISSAQFLGCKSTAESGRRNSANKNIAQSISTPDLLPAVQQHIDCLNDRNVDCLLSLYAEDYKSFSPILTPSDLAAFVRETVNNLRRNNFAIAARIKDIDQGSHFAYVAMDWQLKVKDETKANDPFANVQRIDLWKLDKQNKWRIFRTVIYNERAF